MKYLLGKKIILNLSNELQYLSDLSNILGTTSSKTHFDKNNFGIIHFLITYLETASDMLQ